MARKQKRYKRRQRGRFAFLYRLLAFVVVLGCIVGAMAWFFKVDTIRVVGNARYSAEEVVASSGISGGQNLFFFNKYSAATKICEELPYIQSVSINRKLPSGIVIDVEECSSAAAIAMEGQLWLISGEGKIVNSVEISQKDLYAVVKGVGLVEPTIGKKIQATDETDTQAEVLLRFINEANNKGLLGKIQSIDLTDHSLVSFSYIGRFTVQMEPSADFDYRLDYLVAVVAKLDSNETGTIDLTQDGKASFIPG